MFTLNHGVEGVDGGQIWSDADILFTAGWLDVHGDGLVHVPMQVCDHSRWKRNVCQTPFAVIAAQKRHRLGVKERTAGSPYL